MSKKSYSPDQRLDASVVELRRMLEMLVEYRRSQSNIDPSLPLWEQPVPPLQPIDLAALKGKPPTRWEAHIKRAKEDPLEAAFGAVIREEGWRIYADGGIDLMQAVFHAVIEGNDHLASILDHRWEAIGVDGRGIWIL